MVEYGVHYPVTTCLIGEAAHRPGPAPDLSKRAFNNIGCPGFNPVFFWTGKEVKHSI